MIDCSLSSCCPWVVCLPYYGLLWRSHRKTKNLLSRDIRQPSPGIPEDGSNATSELWRSARSAWSSPREISSSIEIVSVDLGRVIEEETGNSEKENSPKHFISSKLLDYASVSKARSRKGAVESHDRVDWKAQNSSLKLEKFIPDCTCGFGCHTTTYDPKIPIITGPGIQPGSYHEILDHALSICGHWITILGRSQSLDAQMTHVGISRVKRIVMNRYAVPFTAVLLEDATLLRSWIGTPVGPKYMHASLIGDEIVDSDAEVGVWAGIAKMVDMRIQWFCGGRPVRALQLRRTNPQLGVAYETRVVLPDHVEGKVMLFNIALYPVELSKRPIFVDRILRFVRPLDGTEQAQSANGSYHKR